MRIKEIKKAIKEFETYDRVYYDGKISSLIIVILSFLAIGCFILGFIVFK